ncbi:protein-tyrosine-phosphatase [Thalassobaculum fulvum]|uniref:Protein-tyrosine-phosphatase n=1 Tax=Thalassobaculum fulvum TaxID=1633335 RepID=A0A919CP68_9PROT|nr:tyrosine-protein phosphatase [Thalassobaculum fulvum]GHD48916.1 protein-tyrosine-phosphatase [Thalassobaculum fulvum]
MAGEHRPDHRPLHQGRRLTDYPIAAVDDGRWAGRLALGPVPAEDGDATAIAEWGASCVLGLTTPGEAAALGWGDIAGRFAALGIPWLNAPIEDFTAPDTGFERRWPAILDRLLARLAAGERVLVHCRGGKGRSGTVTAALLVAGGMTPDAAIAAVRRVRPGAIETPEQEAWIRRLATTGATGPD